jgi:hypothetical protein
MRRCLTYSDLSEILGYIGDESEVIRSDDDLRDLFAVTDKNGVRQSMLDIGEMREILHNLYWLLSIVLRISPLRDAYIAPRDVEDYQGLKMSDILGTVLGFRHDGRIQPTGPWDEAVQIIEGLDVYRKHGNDRSKYLRELKQKSGNTPAEHLETYQYAEAIVDLCYNYACEISICDSSKRYDVEDLKTKGQTGDTFRADFARRLNESWGSGAERSQRFLLPETNTFERFPAERYRDVLPDIGEIVRYAEYSKAPDLSASELGFVPRYEFQQEEQRKGQRKLILSRIWRRVGFALVCVLVACVIELAMNGVQSLFDDQAFINTVAGGIVETLLFLLISEFVTSFISHRVDGFLSLSEALGSIGQLCSDAARTIVRKTEVPGLDSEQDSGKRESPSQRRPIQFVTPKPLGNYIKFRNNPANAQLFAPMDDYPLADLSGRDARKRVIATGEKLGRQFGIVYKSPYNMLVVDPVESSQSCYPYERVIPRAGNGVVIVPRHGEKYVLLRQGRHAIRQGQLGFPRGYSEVGADGEADVSRELSEELNAVAHDGAKLVGHVFPDSGLTSSKVGVYLVDIDGYNVNIGHEGIRGAEELTPEELRTKIGTGEIEDGFTISAFALMEDGCLG